MDVAAVSAEFARFVWREPASAGDFLAASHSGAYPTLRTLATHAPLVAVGIFLAKLVLDAALLRPIARAILRLKDPALPFKSDKLDAIYVKHKPALPDINEIKSLSSAIDKPVEDLNNWFRVRQVQDRNVVKLRTTAESLWRLAVYSICLGINLSILRGKPWVKNIAQTWEGLPLQPQEEPVLLFFTCVQLPLYLVLLFTQVTDGRRAKDMWEMTIHHALVVVLMVLLYLGNFCRIGMIGLALHDVTDLLLESSKLAHNARFKGLADLLFTGFAAAWFYCRLYKFSTLVLASLFTHGTKAAGPAINVFAGLLLVLVLLNLFWFLQIARMLYRLLWAGAEKQRRQRDFTDLSTDDDVDSDSSYMSDVEPLKRHED